MARCIRCGNERERWKPLRGDFCQPVCTDCWTVDDARSATATSPASADSGYISRHRQVSRAIPLSTAQAPEAGHRRGGPLGVEVGAVFADRRALASAGVHRPLRAGICGTSELGAESIVLSGGYEDDSDRGNVIIYTGQGGNDAETGRQIADQELSRGNLALEVSRQRGLPVRVIRGKGASPFAPRVGYRYDGLYYVVDAWQEVGRSGFRIWRFRLERASNQPPLPSADEDN